MQAAEAAKLAAQAGEGEDGETMDGSQEKEEEMIGVTHIVIDVHDRSKTVGTKIQDSGKLPSVEEVGSGAELTKLIVTALLWLLVNKTYPANFSSFPL